MPAPRLGGKAITLTCKQCNPAAGSKLEAALARERDLDDFGRQAERQWRGKLVTGDEVVASVSIAWRAIVGHLRTAYLAAFAKLGYAFLLNPLGARIRDQIANPEREEVRGFLALATEAVDPRTRAIVICTSPVQCLAVQMGHRIVVLPWPPSGVDPYEAIQQLDGERPETCRGQAMAWPTGMELVLDQMVEQRGAENPRER